jgi:hypothetical protein
MDEQTTTEQSTVETGAPVAQPEAVETSPAAETAPVQPETETSESTSTEPSADEQLKAWAQNKGINVESESELKLAQMARNAEKAMHEKSRKAAELEKSVVSGFDSAVESDVNNGQLDPDDPRIAVRRLEIKQNVRDFFDTTPEAKDYEQDMIKIVQSKPHLSDDLEALYALALKNDVSSKKDSLKSEGAKEALETLAQKQRASAPVGNAVNPVGGGSQEITPQNVDDLVAKHGAGSEWYRANRASILRASGMSSII